MTVRVRSHQPVYQQARLLPDLAPTIRRSFPKTGKSGRELHAEHVAWLVVQPTVTSCAFCDDWTYEGPADRGHVAFVRHQSRRHPELAKRKKRKRNRSFAEQSAAAVAARERERAKREAA